MPVTKKDCLATTLPQLHSAASGGSPYRVKKAGPGGSCYLEHPLENGQKRPQRLYGPQVVAWRTTMVIWIFWAIRHQGVVAIGDLLRLYCLIIA